MAFEYTAVSRGDLAKAMYWRRVAVISLALFVANTYDFTQAQLLPEKWQQNMPRIADVLGGLALVGLVFLFLFHWAHRFRYALVDLGLGRIGTQAWLFYGTALAGTIVAGLGALRL